MVPLHQCFSTFFDSQNPFLAIVQFGSTLGYNLLVNRRKVETFAAPLELIMAPMGSAAPQLRTTALRFTQVPHYAMNFCILKQAKTDFSPFVVQQLVLKFEIISSSNSGSFIPMTPKLLSRMLKY